MNEPWPQWRCRTVPDHQGRNQIQGCVADVHPPPTTHQEASSKKTSGNGPDGRHRKCQDVCPTIYKCLQERMKFKVTSRQRDFVAMTTSQARQPTANNLLLVHGKLPVTRFFLPHTEQSTPHASFHRNTNSETTRKMHFGLQWHQNNDLLSD